MKRLIYQCSPFVSIFEKQIMSACIDEKENLQPIFLIGAPRTGSTFLYQILTNCLDLTYIDNLTAHLFRNLYFGTCISHALFQNKPHNCFRSIHGNTKGMRSPNECGEFWYQWLPEHKHFIDSREIRKESIQEIRTIIFSIIEHFQRPFFFKNMNMGLRMRLISEIAPNAKFVFITRDPIDVATSILEVRKQKFGNLSQWWSLRPRNFEEIEKLNPAEQVVKQVFYIEKQIYEDKNKFKDKNFIKVRYEDLLDDPDECVRTIKNYFNLSYKQHDEILVPSISKSRPPSLSKGTIDSVHSNVMKLDWNFDGIKF